MTLKIPTGQISAAIEIPIIRDGIEEEDEYFTINFLSTSENTILTNAKIDVFIENSPTHQNPLEITKVIYLKELQEFNNVANIETFSSKNGDGVSEVLEIIGGLKN